MEKLGPLNLYTLRLIGARNRFYKLRQATIYLEKHGYIERTGRNEMEDEKFEFTITDKGREALKRCGEY